MRKLLGLLIVLIPAWPVQAHFIWLVPQKDGAVQMVFSDSLDPDGNVPITKVAQTKVAARSGSIVLDAKKAEEKDHYLITVGAKTPAEIVGVCQYGVLAKKGDPYLLMYYAKTTNGNAKSEAPPKGWTALPLEIVSVKTGVFQVLWQGKDAADAELTALIPGDDDPRTLKRQADGTFLLEGVTSKTVGSIGLRAKLIEKRAGELDGKTYKEVRHYSTWTFAVGQR